MENNIEISFCIPTYNNVASLKRLVLSILDFNNPNIEIVVLDNGSTDDTLDVLKKDIVDQRLHIYSNGTNKGALFNMLNVLDKGKGKYLVYCTDHDYVDNTKIERFRNFLSNNSSVSCGYCEYDSKSDKLFELYNVGYQALSKMGYFTRHPTGFFFKQELWRLIDPVSTLSDFEFVDLFPLEFVFAELSLLGDGAIYHDALFKPERGTKVRKHKSATTDGRSKSAFFAPQTRLKLAVNFNKHLCTLNIPEEQKRVIAADLFYRELSSATLGYKKIMFDDAICEHYYMEKRVVGKKELFNIAFNFYLGYVNRVIKIQHKSYFQQTKFKAILFLHLIKKISKKIMGS